MEKGGKWWLNSLKRLKLRKESNFVFVASGLDFVAPGLGFVASGLEIHSQAVGGVGQGQASSVSVFAQSIAVKATAGCAPSPTPGAAAIGSTTRLPPMARAQKRSRATIA